MQKKVSDGSFGGDGVGADYEASSSHVLHCADWSSMSAVGYYNDRFTESNVSW